MPRLTILALLLLFSLATLSTARQGDGGISMDTDSVGVGYVVLISNLESFYLELDKRVYHINEGDTLTFPTGDYRGILFANGHLNSIVYLNVQDNKTTRMRFHLSRIRNRRQLSHSSYPYFYWNSNVIIQAEDDVLITIDDTPVGTGTAKLNIMAGNYIIRAENQKFGWSKTRKIIAGENTLINVDMLMRPKRYTLLTTSLIPGYSQALKGERVKSWLIPSALAASVSWMVYENNKYRNLNKDYEEAFDSYIKSQNETDAKLRGGIARDLRDRTTKRLNRRNLVIGIISAVYVANYIDGIRKPPFGYRLTPEINPYIIHSENGSLGVAVSASWRLP